MHKEKNAAGEWENCGYQQELLEKDGGCVCGMGEEVGQVEIEQGQKRGKNTARERCGIFLCRKIGENMKKMQKNADYYEKSADCAAGIGKNMRYDTIFLMRTVKNLM